LLFYIRYRNEKAKINESIGTTISSQVTRKKRKINKKSKINNKKDINGKRNRNYTFHLQAVKSTIQGLLSKYPYAKVSYHTIEDFTTCTYFSDIIKEIIGENKEEKLSFSDPSRTYLNCICDLGYILTNELTVVRLR
jgi:hypothetical protein